MKKLLFAVLGIISIFVLFPAFKNGNSKEGVSAENGKCLMRTDTLKINDKECALFLKYRSQDLYDMKKEYGSEEDFYDATDHMIFYKSIASDCLEYESMKTIYVDTTYSVINFQNKYFVNILDTTVVKDIMSSVILYKEGKKPIVVFHFEVNTEYDKYFLE